MIRISQYVWLILFVEVLSPILEAVPINPCKRSDNSSLKTWGPGCKYMCHCKHNGDCSATGYCLDGCERGWDRLTPNGSCSFRILDSTLNSQSVTKPTRLLIVSKKRDIFARHTLKEKSTMLYRFSPEDTCVQDHRGMFTKLWSITADPPLLVKIFKVSFHIQPRADDIITSTFRIKHFANYSLIFKLTKDSSDNPNMFYAAIQEFFITDSISIAVMSKNRSKSCSPLRIAGFFLYGLPVCPFRKWGLRCRYDCQCPCAITECHPTTGSCLERGFACPPRKYGPFCSYDCSPACGGYIQQCHVLTGTCKECREPNMTGVDCQSKQSKQARVCVDISDLKEPEVVTKSTFNISKELSLYRAGDTQGHKKTVAFIIFVFLIVFLLLCCGYVQMLHYCAKRRLREQFECMNEERIRRASMVTYTEFNKEFKEMQEYKRHSSLGLTGRRNIYSFSGRGSASRDFVPPSAHQHRDILPRHKT